MELKDFRSLVRLLDYVEAMEAEHVIEFIRQCMGTGADGALVSQAIALSAHLRGLASSLRCKVQALAMIGLISRHLNVEIERDPAYDLLSSAEEMTRHHEFQLRRAIQRFKATWDELLHLIPDLHSKALSQVPEAGREAEDDGPEATALEILTGVDYADQLAGYVELLKERELKHR